MAKTIYEKIMAKEITSIELKSMTRKELYIYHNGKWTDVLDDFPFERTPEELCEYLSDYIAWVNFTDVELKGGKAEHRQAINNAKNLLKEFFEDCDYSSFPKLYKTLSAKEKEAVYLVASHTTVNEGCIVPVTFPTTSELSLLWNSSVRQQKRKGQLVVTIMTDLYNYKYNLFSNEVINREDCEILTIEEESL